jgi:hypothetical protein
MVGEVAMVGEVGLAELVEKAEMAGMALVASVFLVEWVMEEEVGMGDAADRVGLVVTVGKEVKRVMVEP